MLVEVNSSGIAAVQRPPLVVARIVRVQNGDGSQVISREKDANTPTLARHVNNICYGRPNAHAELWVTAGNTSQCIFSVHGGIR